MIVRLWCCCAVAGALEVLPPPGTKQPTPVAAALPTIVALPHAGEDDAAYVVEDTLLVGVPADAALAPAGTETWVLPHRVADGGAQAAVRGAAPRATRVVHRLDAGRGDYRRDDADTLLSAAGANLRPGAKATARKLDDGPWPLPGAFDLVARWTPGPTQGHCVLRADVGGARVLFSGRLAGYDPRAGAVSAFALEAEHRPRARARRSSRSPTTPTGPGTSVAPPGARPRRPLRVADGRARRAARRRAAGGLRGARRQGLKTLPYFESLSPARRSPRTAPPSKSMSAVTPADRSSSAASAPSP